MNKAITIKSRASKIKTIFNVDGLIVEWNRKWYGKDSLSMFTDTMVNEFYSYVMERREKKGWYNNEENEL